MLTPTWALLADETGTAAALRALPVACWATQHDRAREWRQRFMRPGEAS
jgi:hypothetical protein